MTDSAPTTPRFCTQCGTSLGPNAAFCTNCGTPVAKAPDVGTVPGADPTAVMNQVSEPTAILNPAASTTAVMGAQDPYANAAYDATPTQPWADQTMDLGSASYYDQSSAGAYGAMEPATYNQGDATYYAGNQPQQGKSKKPLIITLVIVIVLIIAGVAGFFIYQHIQDTKAEEERLAQLADEEAHRTQKVTISCTIPGYNASTSSPIPLAISGTDFEGNAVDEELAYTNDSNTPVELMRGTYDISITSSPILSDGTIFSLSGAHASVVVSDTENGTTSAPKASFTLTAIDPLQVTDQEIQAAYDGLIACGVEQAKAQSFREAAENRRQTALDQKAAQEQQLQEQQAAAAAAQERSSKKTSFQNKLKEIPTNPSDPAQTYNDLDALLNEVYQYLKTQLSEEEFKTLQTEELQWISDRDKAMDRASTTDGAARYRAGCSEVRTRINQLIAMIP